MENTEEFNVADTMLWQKVKEGLTRKWLENETDDRDVDYLVDVYNDEYDGGIFGNLEDAIYNAFSDVCEAFECGENSQGYYNSCDNWFKVESYENLLYSWDDYDMLEKLRDEMGHDIRYLAEDIEENKIDPDGTYIEVVKDISLTQRHFSTTMENLNAKLHKYIEENITRYYKADELKTKLSGFGTIEVVPISDEINKLIEERNAKVKELLITNSAFFKGALYNTIIENNAKSYNEVSSQFMNYYGLSNEFMENHQSEIDEVNLNFAKIGEFIQ